MTSLHTARRSRMSRSLVVGATAVMGVAGSLTLGLTVPAAAQGDATAVHTSIVSDKPASFTPAVKDGVVESVVQVGNTIVIGGTFTQLVKAQGTTTYTRTGLAAFDATTGAVSTTFNPVLNGEVTSLEVAADGKSVYVGGAFNTVNSVTRKKVAQVNIADGSLVTAFKATGISSGVADIRLVDGTLWIGGQFKTVNSKARVALATLNATTGALTDQSTLVFAGLHNGGTTNIRELAVTPDHTRLIAMGNFTTVNGSPRDQVALIDISGATAALSTWQTNFFTSVCAKAFDTFMRDVAISPDGTYAVFATTGAYHAGTSCDTTSRFDITGTSAGVTPTWVNMTGGDTTTAVAIVGSVVYVGGHFRWENNSSAADKAGQGSVARTGLAALNPINGMPFPWNPTRERGYGVYDFLATSTGLWVGSDTDLIGDSVNATTGLPGTDGIADGYHPRIAFLPLAGGSAITPDKAGSLPGDVLSVSPGASTSTTVTSTPVNASAQPGTVSTMTSSDTWGDARGAFLVDNTLYTAWSNRLLYASPVGGTTVGARTQVNLSAAATCTTSSGSCAGAFSLDVPTITGMFYDSGRVYYTLSGGSTLYYRYFEPQGGVVGSVRYTAGSVTSLANARGMFMSGGKIYFADNANSGRLYSLTFSGVVSGTPTLVDTRDWRARGLALRGVPAANVKPHAVISVSCAFRACSFTGSNSTDSDGTVDSYAWDFGDGAHSTTANPQHTFGADDTYAVSLTVTDDDGATDEATSNVTVAGAPVSQVGFRTGVTLAGTATTSKITVPAATQVDDQLLLFVTTNVSTTFTVPSGWLQIGEQPDGTPDMVTRVYSKTAVAADPSSQVTVVPAVAAKTALTLLVYSGVSTSVAPVVASAPEGSTSASHAAPAVAVAHAGSWVVSYWADKTAGPTTWTLPGSMTGRGTVLGTGASVSSAVGDSAGPVPTGTWAGATATSSTSGGKATSFSIVLTSA